MTLSIPCSRNAALGLAPFGLVVPVERLLIPWHASRRLWLGARPEG
ncbi:MAG: hypothetical protein N3D77_15250 [Geminicoccaceae bacterium]|nr:hypothetical protein [Geminicoccaceae bacterium]